MTPADIKRFHEDLKAAIMAKVPLETGPFGSRCDLLTLVRVDQLQTQIETEISDQEIEPHEETQFSTPKRLGSIPNIPRRYEAALQTFDRIGSMTPVLDGLSVRAVSIRKASQVLRWTWFYLGLLILVAYCGLLLFSSTVEPVIADLRADSQFVVSQNNLAPADFLADWPTALPLVGCGLAVLFGWALLGGTRRMTTWFGGANYSRLRSMNSVLNTMQLLAVAGTPLTEAIAVSCDLVGIDPNSQGEIQEFAPTGISQAAARRDHLSLLADRCLLKMKYRTSVLMISIVGGLVSVLYGVLVFRPITSLLAEIGKATI